MAKAKVQKAIIPMSQDMKKVASPIIDKNKKMELIFLNLIPPMTALQMLLASLGNAERPLFCG